jgi:hypothetical protein
LPSPINPNRDPIFQQFAYHIVDPDCISLARPNPPVPANKLAGLLMAAGGLHAGSSARRVETDRAAQDGRKKAKMR